jgi:CRISPR associated protein Cas1
MLNYLFGLAVSQMTIALAAAGLDPGIGIFHADKEGRASLVYDAIEPVRPYIEAWLLYCIAECRFAKRDFYEEPDGTIRLTRPLSSWLALTAPLWRQAADVVARWLADTFATMARLGGAGPGSGTGARFDDAVIEAAETGEALLPTRPVSEAAERRNFEPALRSLPAPLPALPAPGRAYKPALAQEVIPRACHECGRALMPSKSQPHTAMRRKFCSASCAAIYRAEMRRLIPLAQSRGSAAEIAAIRAIDTVRTTKLRGHMKGRQAWERAHHDDAEAAALRRWYAAKVAPRLGAIERTTIARTLGVSRVYARDLTRGKVPHPRHFAALAQLTGAEMPMLVGG